MGRYPLNTVICYGHQWHYGVKLLVDAAPSVLFQFDPTNAFYLLQFAATVCIRNSGVDGLDLI